MSFGTGYLDAPQAIGSGELVGVGQVLSFTTFEDNLKTGRFAKYDTGSLDNLDGSATPTLAGVVRRFITSPISDSGVIDADLFTTAEVVRQGIVTVDVKSGETPAKFGRVYVSNAGDANDGLATATNTDLAVNAEFLWEVRTGVWAIYVNPAPGDVAAHVGDATAAHAASAISLLDAGGLTTATEVEAVVAELLVRAPVAIADPGDAGAIPVTRSGTCAITTAAAETRTLAIPTFAGQVLSLSFDVDVGDAVVTVAAAVNQTGNNTLTLADAGDHIRLEGVQVAGALVWRVIANDGVALSTV